MKNLKMLYIALIALVAGAFGACTNEFEPGPQMPGPQVSFLSSNPTKVEFTGAASENTQKLTLTRIEKEEELTVDLLIEVNMDYATIFSIPETVTFAAGEATTELVYTVNQNRLEENKEYTVSFLIADEMMSTPYGYTEWKVNHVLNQWELMTDANGNNAKGKFRGLPVMDNQLTGLDFAVEVDVDIYKHKKESKYRIKEPWAMLIVALFDSMGVTVTVDQVKASFDYTAEDVIIDVSDHTNVTVPLQAMGLNDVHGFWVDGYTLGDFFYQGYGGTLEDGVITFPAGSFFCNCGLNRDNGVPDDDPDYCAGANGSGLFRVILPGYEAADYSLGVAYDGMDVAADNETTTAKFKFTYGADVTGIKYMIVNGNVENNPTEALTTLFAGEDENIKSVENFVKEGKEVGVKVGLERGKYTLVAAPADKNGALYTKEAIVYYFYFPGLGDMEDHSCKIWVETKKTSESADTFGEEIVAANPDYSSFAYCLMGEELKYAQFLITSRATVDAYAAMGVELVDLVKQYGTVLSEQYLALVNTPSGFASIANKLDYNTEYVVAMYAENDYEETAFAAVSHTTDDINYTGELVIGDYRMYCSFENKGTIVEFENIFRVIPNGTSDTQFLVSDLGWADSHQYKFNALYDSTAHTLTLDGTLDSSEGVSVIGAELYGTYGPYSYTMFNATSAESYGNDPVVFGVDPTTKQISTLNSLQLEIAAYQSGEYLGSLAIFFGDSTTIAPYVPTGEGESASASVKSVDTPSVNTLIRNIRKAEMLNIATRKVQRATLSNNTTAANFSKKTLRTVKPSLVESYTPEKSTSFKLKTNIKAFAR